MKNNISKSQKLKKTGGFTLAELLIATTILALIVTFAASIYSNVFASIRNLKAANLVYEETRFVMERIVKEIRNGTVDYEEYYNQNENFFGFGLNTTYGLNYCQYSRQFYSPGPDGVFGTYDDEHMGKRNEEVKPAIGREAGLGEYEPDPIQEKLFIINMDGNQRTYIKKIETTDEFGNPIGKIGILKLTGEDWGLDHKPQGDNTVGEGDGRIDTWVCNEEFLCCTEGTTGCTPDDVNYEISDNSFAGITPASLDIVDLKFFISPMDDPRKAFNDIGVQTQPHVTIKIIARANKRMAHVFRGTQTPNIVLETTISARAYNEIITECNLKECMPGQTRPCPRREGVTQYAKRECVDYVWETCRTSTYLYYASTYCTDCADTCPPNCAQQLSQFQSQFSAHYLAYYEPDYAELPPEQSDATFFERGNEFASCETIEEKDQRNSCIQMRCSDGVDNDGNAKTDSEDPNCQFRLCNNGIRDEDPVNSGEYLEECVDVGGICQYFRPLEDVETSCFDNYDNDCNYDPYKTPTENIELEQGADEFDKNCRNIICSNGQLDNAETLGPENYFAPASYDTPHYLFNENGENVGIEGSALYETCPDVGGLCGDTPPGGEALETYLCGSDDRVCKELACSDDIDNDCDGLADEFDPSCIPVICNNDRWDCSLALKDYEPQNYLGDYIDPEGGCMPHDYEDRNDEMCKDIGGICEDYAEIVEIVIDDLTRLFTFSHSHVNQEADISACEAGDNDACKSNITACQDGLDNDCDGDIDGDDDDCCPDKDNDGFILHNAVISEGYIISGTCYVQTPGLRDCDDTNLNISPDADEICGNDVDDNCSKINEFYFSDDGSDERDPNCCVDTDGDGYGVADAHIYAGDPSDPDQPPGCYKSTTLIDCDDTSADIHPNILETGDKCSNDIEIEGHMAPVNDNCKIFEVTVDNFVPQANHIDWYADKNWAWFEWYSGEDQNNFDITWAENKDGGIPTAYELKLFDPDCCRNPDGSERYEVCDDAEGSDENCNGLTDLNDEFCIDSDNRGFYDNFNTKKYLSAAASYNIQYDLENNQLSIADTGEIARVTSELIPILDLENCPNITSATLTVQEEDGDIHPISYEISNYGSVGDENWFAVGNGETFTFPSEVDPECTENCYPSGHDNNLRWRATLSSSDHENSPILHNVKIDFTCE